MTLKNKELIIKQIKNENEARKNKQAKIKNYLSEKTT